MAEKTQESNGLPEELTLDEDAKSRSIVEAILTASDIPVTAGKLVELIGGETGPKEVRRYVDELNEVYVESGRSFRITEVAGGFQFSVHHEFAPWIRRLLQEKPARLSQAALEVLSIVAFKQPITKAEVEHIRGVASDGVLRHLMEKGLIRISGRSDGVGRPLLYGTARDFLKFFGLKTLADLPKVREIEDLLKEEAEEGSGLPTDDSEEGPEGEALEVQSAQEAAEAGHDAEPHDPQAVEAQEQEQEQTDGISDEESVTEDAVAESEEAADAEVEDETDSDEASEEGEQAGETEQIPGEGGDRLEESV